jgi:two-component system, NtrC family, nitrogen regulation response regulator GlnG
VRHFFKQGEAEGLQTKRIAPAGIDLMKRYPWPGNVRELENLVRRLAALYPQDDIGADIIEAELQTAQAAEGVGVGTPHGEELTISQAVEMHLQRYFASFGTELPPPGLYHRILTEVEYPLVLASMTATRGNQIKAAELLGVNRNTLRKKIRELGVNVYRGARG